MEDYRIWLDYADLVYKRKKVKAEALFVHAWASLQEEGMEFTAEMFKRSGAEKIFLNGNNEYAGGVPGAEHWRKRLAEKYGIPEKRLEFTASALHTLEEAKEFARLASGQGIEKGIVISVPQHAPRAFLTDLEVFKLLSPTTALSVETFGGIDWEEVSTIKSLIHGREETVTRVVRLIGECAKIMSYRKKYESGDKNFIIASVEEGLKYLN